MISKTKNYPVLEVSDLEEAVSKYYGRKIKISDMKVILFDHMPLDKGTSNGVYFVIEPVESKDEEVLFSPELVQANNWPEEFGDTPYLEEEYIFDFDVSKFGSYERETDTSDCDPLMKKTYLMEIGKYLNDQNHK